ncbi:hypothetical protein B0H11DRAFT_2232950 [Mycena galericulata]|nr:hypothetical protein B0H11DRAFT_2232950 [Mycena galericulata]
MPVEPNPATPQSVLKSGEAVERLLHTVKAGRLRVADPLPKASVFCPRMELYDDPDSENVIATFELPGVRIPDLSIFIKQGMLVIRGQRLCRYRLTRRHPSLPAAPQVDGVDATVPRAETSIRFFPYRELRYGHFFRRLRLPSGTDLSCITASLSDGLLTVTWPRGSSCQLQQTSKPSATAMKHLDSTSELPTSCVRSAPYDPTRRGD